MLNQVVYLLVIVSYKAGIKCDGKLWVFDRMFGHQLKTGYFMTYEAIGSRKECEDLCLKFVNYPCRYINY